ncbi:MAG: arginine repressor [Eubacteriales bacterium]
MKSVRQSAILEIIQQNEIETQDDLVKYLNSHGFNVTQATVSRDIKELKLIKVLADNGVYKYAKSIVKNHDNLDFYINIFKDCVKSIVKAGNMIVVKTLSGSANSAAELIDCLEIPEVAGTIAGDNTIFIAVKDESSISDIIKMLNNL